MILTLILAAPFVALFLTIVFFRVRAWRRTRKAFDALGRNAGLRLKPFESVTAFRARYAEHVSMVKRHNSYAGYRRNDGD